MSKYYHAPDDCGASNNKDCCPPDLSNANSGANLSTTSFDGDVTTDKDEGTVYACARPSATSKRTCAQIIAGTGCTDTSSKAGNGGVVDFSGADNFSGLTASTEYAIDYCHDYDSRTEYEVLDTNPVTTLAGGGGGGGDLTGSVVTVCASGHPDAPCDHETILDINNNVVSLGADVCIMDDTSFTTNTTLIMDWGGEDADRARVGGCYVDTGDANKLRWYDDGTGTGRGAKPDMSPTTGNNLLLVDIVANNMSLTDIILQGPSLYSTRVDQAISIDADRTLIEDVEWYNVDGFAAVTLEPGAQHNKIIDWTCEGMGTTFPDDIDIGTGNCIYAGYNGGTRNVIQGGVARHCGHDCLDIENEFNVIRGNDLNNDWSDLEANISGQPAGYKAADFLGNADPVNQGNLIEDNHFHGSGEAVPASLPAPMGAAFGGGRTIVRRNFFYHNNSEALSISTRSGNERSTYLKVYNNTIVHSGRSCFKLERYSSELQQPTDVHFKNNICYLTSERTGTPDPDLDVEVEIWSDPPAYTNGDIANIIFANNIGGREATPTTFLGNIYDGGGNRTLATLESIKSSNFFSNTIDDPELVAVNSVALADPNDASPSLATRIANLTPAGGSPSIDGCAHLTQVNDPGGGTGTAFVVDDATYFFDGWGIPDLDGEGAETGDSITVGADTGLVVTDVDYTTNTVTVDTSFTWADGENVWLDYNGTNMDCGAVETP